MTTCFTRYLCLGAMSLKSRVNYEQDTSFIFEVFATDLPITDKKTGTTTVTITVSDSNENTPLFATTFSASIPENISAGGMVVQVFLFRNLILCILLLH